MPGAGKSTIANGLKLKGFYVINMGNIVREIAKKNSIIPTLHNLGTIMYNIRKQHGTGVIANIIKKKIVGCTSNVIIIDGVRSTDEFEILKKFGNAKILSIHASTNRRYRLLSKRKRSDDPKTKKCFNDRDMKEIRVGISTLITLSDENISNNNLTIQELIDSSYRTIKNWL